jgi:hypothetical protein
LGLCDPSRLLQHRRTRADCRASADVNARATASFTSGSRSQTNRWKCSAADALRPEASKLSLPGPGHERQLRERLRWHMLLRQSLSYLRAASVHTRLLERSSVGSVTLL